MKEFIRALLREEKITVSGAISLSRCTVKKAYLLERAGISSGSVLIFAIPYYTKACDTEGRNISSYAVGRDYHEYASLLSERILPKLNDRFPENRFALFADHSPIDERSAAVLCGIGFFGDNGLVVNDEYSSYFFLAEIVTDASLEEDQPTGYNCLHCGKCGLVCPMNADNSPECLSAITQKKGALSEAEQALIKKYNTRWGCDLCQEACPYTVKAKKSGSIYTEIGYFSEETKPILTEKDIESTEDGEFAHRAYSWRGRDTVLRNLRIK